MCPCIVVQRINKMEGHYIKVFLSFVVCCGGPVADNPVFYHLFYNDGWFQRQHPTSGGTVRSFRPANCCQHIPPNRFLDGFPEPSPGPTTKYPCPLCACNITGRGVSYLCNHCSGWVHSKCSGHQNAAEYRRIKD